MPAFSPATQPTMYFIGVTTGQSSIMQVFPAWARHLGIDAVMRGIDFPPNSPPAAYCAAVDFIKADALSMGALVTTHKLNLLRAARGRFDWLDPYAETLGEISSISKRGARLIGHAKDPITAGLSLEAALQGQGFADSGAHLLLLGSGGSSLALTLYLHNRQQAGADVPGRIIVTARTAHRLDEMRQVHAQIGFRIPTDYVHTPAEADADALVSALPPRSVVVNATGLGKDRPGSPLTAGAVFPQHGIVWEFNYRGDLLFLDQARAQQASRQLRIEDGWVYFLHGWTRVIAEVFAIGIPTSGPDFDVLGRIAQDATVRRA